MFDALISAAAITTGLAPPMIAVVVFALVVGACIVFGLAVLLFTLPFAIRDTEGFVDWLREAGFILYCSAIGIACIVGLAWVKLGHPFGH